MKCNYEFRVRDEAGEELIHLVLPIDKCDVLGFTSCDNTIFNDDTGKRNRDCIPTLAYLSTLICSEFFEDPDSKNYVPPKKNTTYELCAKSILAEDFLECDFKIDIENYRDALEFGNMSRSKRQKLIALEQMLNMYSTIKSFLKNAKVLAREKHKRFENYKVTFCLNAV